MLRCVPNFFSNITQIYFKSLLGHESNSVFRCPDNKKCVHVTKEILIMFISITFKRTQYSCMKPIAIYNAMNLKEHQYSTVYVEPSYINKTDSTLVLTIK